MINTYEINTEAATMPEILEQFGKEYEFLYDNYDNVAGYDEAVRAFDLNMQLEYFRQFVGKFAEYRKDFISSDREAAAFMFALEVCGVI